MSPGQVELGNHRTEGSLGKMPVGNGVSLGEQVHMYQIGGPSRCPAVSFVVTSRVLFLSLLLTLLGLLVRVGEAEQYFPFLFPLLGPKEPRPNREMTEPKDGLWQARPLQSPNVSGPPLEWRHCNVVSALS